MCSIWRAAAPVEAKAATAKLIFELAVRSAEAVLAEANHLGHIVHQAVAIVQAVASLAGARPGRAS